MSILERIKKLAKNRDISIYQLEEEINIGRNTIYQWNKRTPSADKLQAVADYFNVSVDYLLGRTSDSTIQYPELNEQWYSLMEKVTSGEVNNNLKPLSNNIHLGASALLLDFNKLNEEGRKEALKQVKNLTKISDYTY